MRSVARALWHWIPEPVRYRANRVMEALYWGTLARHDQFMDWRYHVNTAARRYYGTSDRAGTAHGDASHAIPLSYWWILRLRWAVSPGPEDSFIDLGCGTGRALFVFARSSVLTIRGIECDREAASQCRQNIFSRSFGKPIDLTFEDCARSSFTHETIFYLFNPFGPATLRAVLGNIEASLKVNPRRIQICFYETPDRNVLDEIGWLSSPRTIRFLNGTFVIYSSR